MTSLNCVSQLRVRVERRREGEYKGFGGKNRLISLQLQALIPDNDAPLIFFLSSFHSFLAS